MRARWLVGSLMAGAWASAASCRTPTDITFSITTDLKCADVGSTTITVGAPGQLEKVEPTTATTMCSPDGTIGTLVVLPSGSDDDVVAIRVVTGYHQRAESCSEASPANCIFSRRALHYIAHRQLKVLVAMDQDCIGLPCTPDETCLGAKCVPATISDPSQCEGAGCDANALDRDAGATVPPDAPPGPPPPPPPPPPPAATDADVLDAPTDAAGDASDGGCAPGIDFTSDKDNCGSCGHSCLGGLCVASACQPVAIAMSVTAAEGIVVDSKFAYFTEYVNGGNVYKVALDGTGLTPLATNQQFPHGIAVDATNAYWANFATGGAISKAPLTGAGPTTQLCPATNPVQVVVDATSVYFTAGGASGTVSSVPLAGGTATPLAMAQSFPFGIATDGTYVYWANVQNNDFVNKVKISDQTITNLTPATKSPYLIALFGGSVFYTTLGNDVASVSTAGGGAVTSYQAMKGNPVGVTADATGVYWVNTTNGDVKRAPIAGGAAVTLATGQANPQQIVTDATAIYWTNAGSGMGTGSVMRLAK